MTLHPRHSAWAFRNAGAGAYHAWLTDRGSLTARIAQRCPQIRVKLLFQGLRRPNLDEQFIFARGGRTRVLVREILLCCADVPVVFAHTVVNGSSLRGAWRSIGGLGERPLGAAIFSDRRVVRGPLRLRRIRPNHPLFRKACAALSRACGSLWARRSLFELRGEPILVTEVFLPGILEL